MGHTAMIRAKTLSKEHASALLSGMPRGEQLQCSSQDFFFAVRAFDDDAHYQTADGANPARSALT